ncbi:elongation of very long chain fatty acids protein 4 [Exaiptasia diaphana]|uniref:Elongation of very long chain fatty acids protein n=1 Tax=Exaiptasia diaphana TaxID=2652724 RepID=A0A913WTW9_EXADI|nr:elongation of very long chain fatty acids protein 4 [Exaiptasia diaphana]
MPALEALTRLANGAVQLQTTPVVAAYLSFVLVSPVWRRFVPAVEIRKPMIVYNFFCAIASLYSLVLIMMAIIPEWPGSLFDTRMHPYVKHGNYVYWLTKNVELLDTVIMIVRHRTRQVTFLHVFHHSTMALFSEYGYRYGGFPAAGFLLALNSLIHVFLYYYYGQTARRVGMRPIWKKALTELQLTQFFIGVWHQTTGYLYYNFCWYALVYEFSMIILFSNFYYHAYLKDKPKTTTKKVE